MFIAPEDYEHVTGWWEAMKKAYKRMGPTDRLDFEKDEVRRARDFFAHRAFFDAIGCQGHDVLRASCDFNDVRHNACHLLTAPQRSRGDGVRPKHNLGPERP